MLALQRAAGNSAVNRFMARRRLQRQPAPTQELASDAQATQYARRFVADAGRRSLTDETRRLFRYLVKTYAPAFWDRLGRDWTFDDYPFQTFTFAVMRSQSGNGSLVGIGPALFTRTAAGEIQAVVADLRRVLAELHPVTQQPAGAPANPAVQNAYASWLRKATQMLRDADFGTPLSSDFEHDHFDREYWEWDSDDKYGRSLKLRAGKRPSDAIDALFDHLTAWHVDCDHLIQIANLYALRMTFGKAKFDQREGLHMRLRSRESAGLGTRAHFGRKLPSDEWKFITEWRPPDDPKFAGNVGKTTDTLLSEAPVGSRVRFTNLFADPSSAFKHENALKLGNDRYAAAGFDDPVTGNEFTREQLEIRMARMTLPRPSWSYIRASIFVDEIEQFDVW